MTHTLTITSDGHVGAVHLDGHDIGGAVHAAVLRFRAGQGPTAQVDLIVHHVATSSTGAEVSIPDATRAALIALGWTPPAAGDTAQAACNRSHHDILSSTAIFCDLAAGHLGPHQATTPDHARTTWNDDTQEPS